MFSTTFYCITIRLRVTLFPSEHASDSWVTGRIWCKPAAASSAMQPTKAHWLLDTSRLQLINLVWCSSVSPDPGKLSLMASPALPWFDPCMGSRFAGFFMLGHMKTWSLHRWLRNFQRRGSKQGCKQKGAKQLHYRGRPRQRNFVLTVNRHKH